MKVNIYIEIDNRTPKKHKRRWGYVLECVVNGEPRTRSETGECVDTYHGTMITALEKALLRITKPCEVVISGPDAWVLGMLTKQVRVWAKENFLTAQGKPIAYQKQWMHIWCLIEHLGIITLAGKHAYTNWLLEEMKNLPHTANAV